MKLSQLLKGIDYVSLENDVDVDKPISDSRNVGTEDVFVCIRGARFDGHSVAAELSARCKAVVVDHPMGLPNEVVVPDTREAYARMCSNYFGNPQDSLHLIAVTGTNGKTTVATMIYQMLNELGKSCGLIGTTGIEIGSIHLQAKYTTPEPWDLERVLRAMVDAGCSYAVMEASSQALDQKRVDDLRYDVAVFTNFSQDHLDYHKTMENYYQAKKSLFSQSSKAVINRDDEWGMRLTGEIDLPTILVSEKGNTDANLYVKDAQYDISYTAFTLVDEEQEWEVRIPFFGEHSVANALSAFGALKALGFSTKEQIQGIQRCTGVKGRGEIIHRGEKTVICDFAHTEDALKRLLQSVKTLVKGDIFTVYGNAGERDKDKNEAMAKVVSTYSDAIFLSTDNPRSETAEETAQIAMKYFDQHQITYQFFGDRYQAIHAALDAMKDQDVLILAGKGHEDYQVLSTGTMYFDEREIVKEYFSKGN